jgi:hypothetical protein
MALEMGPHKIRVNSISPGLFKSEITEGLMQKDWLNKVMKKTVPLREYGTSNPALTSLVRTCYMTLLNMFRETCSLLMLVSCYQASLFTLPFEWRVM